VPTQLRIYTINRGQLPAFAAAWRTHIRPLREKVGCQVPFGLMVTATNQFVWCLRYDGPDTWEAMEAAYYSSPERRSLDPDPAQWIARVEAYFVDDVDLTINNSS
jgi:hypothetical protein